MPRYPQTIENLIETLMKLPGVGRKTASRYVFYLLKNQEDTKLLSHLLQEMVEKVRLCSQCFNIGESTLCSICSDPKRDKGIICIVEDVEALLAIENTSSFKGLYHVLHGAISPLEGIGPKELKIKELFERIKRERPREIILATDPDVEGEATALYLLRTLKPLGIKITRLAQGLPAGSEVEYADPQTLISALEGRREL